MNAALYIIETNSPSQHFISNEVNVKLKEDDICTK